MIVNCPDFEARIDEYLDGVLASQDFAAAVAHVRECTPCNDLVMSYQHASALLRTAVADKAAAVDVSGMWEAIEASLDLDVEPTSARPLEQRRPHTSFADRVRDFVSDLLGPSPIRVGAFAAAAAALAVLVFTGGDLGGDKSGKAGKVAKSGKSKNIGAVASSGGGAGASGFKTVGFDESKPTNVRIDSLDVAEGHTVATWSRPRTRTQVIWVGSGDDGIFAGNPAHAR